MRLFRPALALLLVATACSAHPAPRTTESAGPAAPGSVSSSPAPAAPGLVSSSPATAAARSTHVFVIVMENHAYDRIIGRPDAPYLNQLASTYGLATDYHGVAHPSLPNYLAMIGGSTFGITSDCTSCTVQGPNIADQMEAAGLSWRVYAEGLASDCGKGANGSRYAKKHNPFVYFTSVSSNAARCHDHVAGLDRLAGDLASPPNLSFIVPDLCHDMHDCDVATGDAWLRGFVPSILESQAWRDGGALVVTFDEDDGSSSNHVATLVARPGMRPAARATGRLDHYSLLCGIENMFGLSLLGHAAGAADLFRSFS